MTNKNYFSYNDGKELTKDAFRISPSQLSKFFDRTSEWYHENFLGKKDFTGNTSTYLGTSVHAGIQMYIDNGIVDWNAVENYIYSIKDPQVDIPYIINQYTPMTETLMAYADSSAIAETEKFVFHEVLPGVVAGGSIDAIQGVPTYYIKDKEASTWYDVTKAAYNKAQNAQLETKVDYNNPVSIIDWKTTSSKTPVTSFSRAYWFQQMTYAWILTKLGVEVSTVRLVYVTTNDVNRISEKTGKPLKSYPSTSYTLSEEVTEEKLELIEGCLNVVAESVQLFKEKPEFRHLLAQDSRFKAKPKPVLFKKTEQ